MKQLFKTELSDRQISKNTKQDGLVFCSPQLIGRIKKGLIKNPSIPVVISLMIATGTKELIFERAKIVVE